MQFVTVRTVSAMLLIVSFALNLGGVFMWNATNTMKLFTETPTYFRWERGLLIAGFVIAALGVALLEIVLSEAGQTVLARLGATAFLIGAVLVIVVEAGFLSGANSTAPLAVIMVFVLLMAEAIVGGALLASGILPAWVGGTVLAWNVGLAIILPVITPHDIYFPVAHFLPLLLIGVALLMTR